MATDQNINLTRAALKGRTFLLGNKRAFSLSLPAASGSSDALLHPHKWFGAYLYGRKFFEGQLVHAYTARGHLLSAQRQTGLTAGLTFARREYQVDGRECSEEYFVPNGVQGFACTLHGDLDFTVEPELDMRYALALNHDTDGYEAEIVPDWSLVPSAVLVSKNLPAGKYDDLTETYVAGDEDQEPVRVYAAIQIVGEGAWADLLPPRRRCRRKLFRKDQQRERFIALTAPGEAVHDHAPLWNQARSSVYAPVRLHLRGHGTVFYGFGATREEALASLDALRDNLLAFQAQKAEEAKTILEHARFETGSPRVDTAYTHVLSRFMDALVARYASAEDTALDRPATMILAGNQYFHDSWKRDENIAVGVLLNLGFYDLARDVIRDTWQLQDEATGRLPQRIRAGEEIPYHSSDGTLWALWRLYQYWRATGDDLLLYEKLSMVALFFRRSLERAVDGMLPSGRTTAPDYLWETWMDTPHTPRDGFPIEIQMLWIACLRVYRPIVERTDKTLHAAMEAAETAAWQALPRFNVRGMPADSLDDQGQVRDLITPNPYFCFGVGLDMGTEMEGAMREIGRRQLAGRQGIRTLAPDDWGRVFSAEFLSDRRNVRGRRMRSIGKFNYHRGVEWNWLSQFFVRAELKYGEPEVAFHKYLRSQVDSALDHAGIGGVSELFDFSGTRGPDFQAWSMAGFLEALHDFAGVRIDVPERRIVVEPQIPAEWPELTVRKWYGQVPFDLRYGGDASTRTLQLDFPWGQAPDASVEFGLVLPERRTASHVEVEVDGATLSVPWRLESVPGTDRLRLRFSLPATVQARITLGLKRVSHRLAISA